MGFNKFNFSVAVQALLLAAVALLLGWAAVNPHLQFTIVYFSVVFVLQVWLLIYTVRQHNRRVREFLLSLKYDDNPVLPAPETSDRSLHELYSVLNEIAVKTAKARSGRDAEHQLFLHTVRHVEVGLLLYDDSGHIELTNEAFRQLLDVGELRRLDALFRVRPLLEKLLTGLQPARPVLFNLPAGDRLLRLSVQLSLFTMQRRRLFLVSFHDIHNALQQEEIETWQKLISILRHEIMNSMGPITSLSRTLRENFAEFAAEHPGLADDFTESTGQGLAAIEKRSAGLMRFVETYRKLSKIPRPEFEILQVCDLLFMTKSLLSEELEKAGVDFRIRCTDRDISITADEKLISQVLINVVRNAVQALEHAKTKIIETVVETSGNEVMIRISDQGEGIASEQLDKVFIPFFTTRQGGSGIGLSLSRQIMQMHGGSISLRSVSGKGTDVELRLRAQAG